jgi:hypothetical protein
MNYSKIPFNTEDFSISWAWEVSLERLHGRSIGIVSPLDADELESNKFNARFRARVALLPPAEVQNVFLPSASTPAVEVFVANFLLGFKALAEQAPKWRSGPQNEMISCHDHIF